MVVPEPETPLIFDCRGTQLLGLLHRGAADAERAVVVVVGGPQYRVGSHRQFVLLARHLAGAGIPTLRFDYRGMGDSEGNPRPFDTIQDDLTAAIDRLFQELPALQQVVLWGLCDGATASAFYAASNPRVAGLILLNPWVRTAAGEAKVYLRHYYTRRLLSRQFWLKLLRGGVQIRQSLGSLGGFLRTTKGPPPDSMSPETPADHPGISNPPGPASLGQTPLPARVLQGLSDFRGPVLLILSGNDLTAKEFVGLLKAERPWSQWARRRTVKRLDLPAADHTFSTALWRQQVETWTLAWLRSW